MLRSRFAAAKHPAKWGFGSEIESFYASQPFRSNKTPCEMGLWLRNWEFLCFAAVSQLQNTLQNGALATKLGVFMLHCHFAAVSQLRNTLRNGALAAKLGVFMLRSRKTPCEMGLWLRKLGVFTLWHFAAVSQLRNEGHCAAKWHSCAKSGFAVAKIFAERGLRLRTGFAAKC